MTETIVEPEAITYDATDLSIPGVPHLFCAVCVPWPIPLGAKALCGAVKRKANSTPILPSDPECPLCELVADLPCPKCGA